MKQFSIITYFFLCWLCYSQLSAQDDNKLVDRAVVRSGPDAVYLREFKVQFDVSEHKKEIAKAKFPVLLSKHDMYRFNVQNEDNVGSRVILELYLKDKLVASTYDLQTMTDKQYFDFKCDKAAVYDVVMYFEKGLAGRAVGVLSKISPLGSKLNELDLEMDILYAQSDNPIVIDLHDVDFAQIDVSIDNGSIVKVNRSTYIAHPIIPGTASLKIRLFDEDATLKEVHQKQYAVLSFDKPYASLRGYTEGKIGKEELLKSKKIDLWFSPDIKCNYPVVSFTISDRNDLVSGISNTSARLSKEQQEWLKQRPKGSPVYVKNIRVKSVSQSLIELSPIQIVIE